MTPTQAALTHQALLHYKTHLRAQGYAPPTIRAKVGIVAAVARTAGVDPAALTVVEVEAYFGRDLEPWSRRKYLEHLRSYGDWAGLDGLTEGMRPARQPRAVPKPCSEPDLALLMATALPRTLAFTILGAFAGMRSFEIAKVRGEDLERTDDGWRIRIIGKATREDVLPVSGLFVRTVLALRDEHGAGRLFPGCSAQAVQMAIHRASLAADVRISAHQLRHRYGTQLYRISRDLILVQRLMRHSSPLTTIGYAQLVDGAGASLVDQLPDPTLGRS